MKQFLLYVTQLKQYRTNVILHFVCYIFTAFFTIISIPAIIPLFEMLFQQEYKVVEKPLNVNGISGMIDELKYHFSSWIAGQDKSTAVMWICVGIAAVFFFKNVFRYFAIYFMTPVRASLVRDTRSKLFAKMIDLPMSYFSDERKGDLIARMTADVHEVEWTLLSTLESWVKDPLIIVGSISFMLYTSPSLTLFVVLLLIGTSFVIGGISRTLKKKSLNAQEEFGDLISLQEESLGGLRVVKVFGAESYIKDRFNAILEKYRKLLIEINRRRELAPPMSEFLGIVIVCILLAYGASLVFSSQIQASTFLAFLYAFFNVIEPSKGISASYFNVQKGVAALDRINEVLNMKISIYDKPNAISKVSFDHQIEFKGVSFQYANSSIKVLEDIHFSLKKGEKIAIVGSSGSGKSTLVDLLARFYDVSKGSITIDGVDIKDIKISDLRSLMGMVTQEPILFNDSIRRNIEFGSKTYSDEMIWTILDTAYASDFIREGNRGLDYNIGDRGSKLSGGQRQRLTLARAILRNPAILILDEATSALDSASEMIVQEAMEHVLENRTAIIIAHRLSTIKKVDKIIVIQDGRIVEQGTHDELINKQGEYFNFVSLQSINH
ncbi:MAG: ABC transporter ATP-binding protein/permease [Saprospiraceae bacterium]|jgi:ABC-type multidrug transport system fused ATPase/permease subunit|nr:ABC transporter ATP-binding protein/permease [Saprospiraceae bacterium]